MPNGAAPQTDEPWF